MTNRDVDRPVRGQDLHGGITGGGGWAFLTEAFATMVAQQR